MHVTQLVVFRFQCSRQVPNRISSQMRALRASEQCARVVQGGVMYSSQRFKLNEKAQNKSSDKQSVNCKLWKTPRRDSRPLAMARCHQATSWNPPVVGASTSARYCGRELRCTRSAQQCQEIAQRRSIDGDGQRREARLDSTNSQLMCKRYCYSWLLVVLSSVTQHHTHSPFLCKCEVSWR